MTSNNRARALKRTADLGEGSSSPSKSLPQGVNRSVVRALGILVDVSRADKPQSFVDLQTKLKLPKASLHKLLFTLESLNFLRRDEETGRYSMGWAAYEISAGAARPVDILSIVSPVMHRLVEEHNETGHIGVLDGAEEIILERVDPPHQVIRLAIGRRTPAYCSSGGLATLAVRGEAAVAALPDKLKTLTPNTVKTRKALQARLKDIRRSGFALDLEEAYAGVRCVGVAIDVPGWPAASMSFSLPLQRASMKRLEQLAAPLLRAAREVESVLVVTPRS